MNRSHCWTPPWSSGSSHTCREHGIKPTEALPLSLHRSTDNGRCVAVGSVAHEAAASAVACRLHVCALHGRCALGVMALSCTRRCSPFPEKKYARCVGGKELGVGELRVHCADRQDRERKRSETLPVACNIIVTIGVRVCGRVSAKALRGIGLVAMQCAPNTCSIHCMMHRKLRMLRRKTYTRVARPVCDVRSFGVICFQFCTRNEGIKFVDPVEMTSQETPDSPFIAVTFSDDVDRSTSRVSYRNAAHNIAYKRLRWLSVCNVYK